jgi:sulfhydrogenase subunit beta (sulfur reductase)
MTCFTLSREGLKDFVSNLLKSFRVVGPQEKAGAEGKYVFDDIQDPDQLCLDYDVTVMSPKKYLLPPRESLLEYKLGDKPAVEARADAEPIVIFGAHPYDVKAISQIDRLFAEDNRDEHYLRRRENTTVIGLSPKRVAETAFWGTMDSATVDSGFDIFLTDVGDVFVAEVATDKGENLMKKHASAKKASEEDIEKCNKVKAALKEMGSQRDAKFSPQALPELLRKSFDHPVWEEKAELCLSCGSCNLVCPTCYCFDVKEDVALDLGSGERYRTWDGCLLEEFASVAGGENFREKRMERYRHRFFRKGSYLYSKCGMIACVGCGRCSSACLPDIADPVTVFNTLQEGA